MPNNTAEIRTWLKDFATSVIPLSAAGLIGAAKVLHIAWAVAVFEVVWGNLATLFTAASITGFTLAKQVPFLPEAPLTTLAVVLGILYVLKLGDKFIDKVQEKL